MTRLFRITLALTAVILSMVVAGCNKSDIPEQDLDAVRNKIHTGMSEFEVTTAAGVPNHIDVDGDTRTLRYDSKSGNGVLKVILKQNVVTDIKTE